MFAKNDTLKIKILLSLKDSPKSINSIRMSIGAVNYFSVRRAVNFLEFIGLVSIKDNVAGSRKYRYVSLTSDGKKALDRILSNGNRHLKEVF